MWKYIVAFIAFAALALWLLAKGGDIDMGGEKHEVPAAAPAPTVAPSAPTAPKP